jgi:hypothetical protein
MRETWNRELRETRNAYKTFLGRHERKRSYRAFVS